MACYADLIRAGKELRCVAESARKTDLVDEEIMKRSSEFARCNLIKKNPPKPQSSLAFPGQYFFLFKKMVTRTPRAMHSRGMRRVIILLLILIEKP